MKPASGGRSANPSRAVMPKMRHATPYGAKRMAKPMIAMQTEFTPSRKAIKVAQRSRTVVMAMPTARAQNMTA